MGKRKKQSAGIAVDPDGWMGTLSDLVFLLITFFVLLITMSSMDAKKLKDAFGFFDSAVGVMGFPDAAAGGNEFMESLSPLADFIASQDGKSLKLGPRKKRRKSAKNMLKALVAGVANNASPESMAGTLRPLAEATGGEVKIIRTPQGIEVVLSSMLLFSQGSSELDQEALAILGDIASLLKLWGGQVDVIAAWSWREGPEVLANVVDVTEKNLASGENLNPILYQSTEHSIRFVLRKRS